MLDDKTKFSGNNTLLLCPADMMRAIEWYLNEVLLKVPVKVTGVHEINTALNSGNFEIKIVPGEAHDA